MSITVRIPTQLRSLTGNERELTVPAGAVRDIIESLESQHPGFGARLLDEHGSLRRFVNLFVADEDVRFLDGLDTRVDDGETLSILPAAAGG